MQQGNSDEKEPEEEIPLDDEQAEVFGQDPLTSKALNIKLHSSIVKYWFEKGIKKEESDNLLEKYVSPVGLEVPKLNQEISLKLPKHSKARDLHMCKRQQLAGSALNSIGAVKTTIIEEKESIDRVLLMEKLHDAGKLIVELMHSQTRSRMASILAGVAKDKKTMLENTKTDEYLFGENLAEKFKEARAMEKVANSIRKQSGHRNQSQLAPKRTLNSNSLQGRRPFPNQAGNRGHQSGQYRPRLTFKNRSRNQPFNQRIQYQGQSRFGSRNRTKY